ncbi:hypothetical protein MHH56_11530 [Paenibacillus sp. FSL K6-3182]|uniref:hypothetical protein n=1 Tax=Paenibacillus sp. FSL K6-3182 TaxID=2921495 RepID=UPI0030D54659
MWKYIEPSYYIALESCLKESCDGEKILEEIVNDHLQKSKGGKSEESKWLVIDTYQLSWNWDEYMRFRRKKGNFEKEGLRIDESY